MDELCLEGYQRLNLATSITLYYKGELWNLHGYDTGVFLKDQFYGCDSLSRIEDYFISFYGDSDLSLIAYDSYTNEVLIYLSPIGITSLYINSDSKISGSINSLINKHSVPDYQYFGLIRKFGYNQNEMTPWKNIKRLLPGYLYKGNKYGLWEKLTRIKMQIRANSPKTLPLYLQDSICSRLDGIEDEEVGVLLSGGLDSSTIAALLLIYNSTRAVPKKFRFFTTENAEDLKYAKEVAEHLKIELEIISKDDVELSDEELFEINETPVDLGSVVPNIKLFKRISELGIKTVFTGDGPDELFRGYRRNSEDFDYHEHDMLNELVYYHFPRLEKAARYFGIHLVTPYITPNIWTMALTNEIKMFKGDLKDMAKGLIPDSVIERTKEPLKNTKIREDKVAYQQDFLKRFISYANKKYENLHGLGRTPIGD